MRSLFSSIPAKIVALILGVGALLTSIGAITGFWDSQILHNTTDTTAVEIVLDASATMNQPLNPDTGSTESKWNSAKAFVVEFAGNRYESGNSYIAVRRVGGACSSSIVGAEERPTVDWPATRYFIGPWQVSGGNDNQAGLRTALDAIQPGGEATLWAAVEDAIGHLTRGPANLGKARRQLVLIYSGSAVDTCHQFAVDRLAAEMSTGDIKLIPISLGQATNTPDNLSGQVTELARRMGVQVANSSSQAQLNQALQTALPVATLTVTPLAAPSALPTASSTPRPAGSVTVPLTASVTALPAVNPTPRPAVTATALPASSPTALPAVSLTPRPGPSTPTRPAASPTVVPAATATPRPTSTATPSPATTPTLSPTIAVTPTRTATRAAGP